MPRPRCTCEQEMVLDYNVLREWEQEPGPPMVHWICPDLDCEEACRAELPEASLAALALALEHGVD